MWRCETGSVRNMQQHSFWRIRDLTNVATDMTRPEHPTPRQATAGEQTDSSGGLDWTGLG